MDYDSLASAIQEKTGTPTSKRTVSQARLLSAFSPDTAAMRAGRTGADNRKKKGKRIKAGEKDEYTSYPHHCCPLSQQ